MKLFYLLFISSICFAGPPDRAPVTWNASCSSGIYNLAAQTCLTTGGSGGVTTMGAFGSSPNANGGTISGSTLTLQPASFSFPGGLSTGNQNIAGNKTFSGNLHTNGTFFAQGATQLDAGNFVTSGSGMITDTSTNSGDPEIAGMTLNTIGSYNQLNLVNQDSTGSSGGINITYAQSGNYASLLADDSSGGAIFQSTSGDLQIQATGGGLGQLFDNQEVIGTTFSEYGASLEVDSGFTALDDDSIFTDGSGDMTVGNQLNVSGSLVEAVDIVSSQADGITFTSCGSSPSAASGSNDTRGVITAGSGATTCQVNFAQTHGTTPVCTISPGNTTAASGAIYIAGFTTAHFVIHGTTVAADVINYQCIF